MSVLDRKPRYGLCRHCGAVEVEIFRPFGFTKVEGESDEYPTGSTCEVCA